MTDHLSSTKSFDEVLKSVADVDGWMSPDQARALFDAASACHTGDQIAEIGSFRGRSTIVLASAAPEGVSVIAIDPHAGNDRGPQEIDGYGTTACDVRRNIKPGASIQKISIHAADERVIARATVKQINAGPAV